MPEIQEVALIADYIRLKDILDAHRPGDFKVVDLPIAVSKLVCHLIHLNAFRFLCGEYNLVVALFEAGLAIDLLFYQAVKGTSFPA